MAATGSALADGPAPGGGADTAVVPLSGRQTGLFPGRGGLPEKPPKSREEEAPPAAVTPPASQAAMVDPATRAAVDVLSGMMQRSFRRVAAVNASLNGTDKPPALPQADLDRIARVEGVIGTCDDKLTLSKLLDQWEGIWTKHLRLVAEADRMDGARPAGYGAL